ncbi:hypothetical protein [Neisseria sp. Ec49-e6-T10]|uniref:hypothetical protein n=1 Tax=Neisseria sp. Ec49-e6-T10 TaxID=3140744 RepID=UPI003EC07DAD
MGESITVFNRKNINDLKKEKGCGFWVASEKRLRNSEFIVCICNNKDNKEEHETAFFIAPISQIERAPEIGKGRLLIKFSQYHELRIPKARTILGLLGRQNPIAYFDTSELFNQLGLDIENLTWQEWVD